MTVDLIMAREPLPASRPAVFLAGPTPDKAMPVPSWRPDALRALAEQWTGDQTLAVLSPESRNGQRADRYETQADWETAARSRADAILFWIPRDLKAMPGMTTNVEFGLDVTSGRAVLGCPPRLPRPGAKPLPDLRGPPPRRPRLHHPAQHGRRGARRGHREGEHVT